MMSFLNQNCCWSCNISLPSLSIICVSCGLPQPISSKINSFELLDLPKALKLEKSSIEKAYFQKQNQVHPDRFVGADEKAKAYSQALSTALNHAYQILKDPLRRAQELIGCERIHDKDVEPEVLSEIMEWREHLETLQSQEELDKFLQQIKELEKKQFEKLEVYLESKEMQTARKTVIFLYYMGKLLVDITHKQFTLEKSYVATNC